MNNHKTSTKHPKKWTWEEWEKSIDDTEEESVYHYDRRDVFNINASYIEHLEQQVKELEEDNQKLSDPQVKALTETMFEARGIESARLMAEFDDNLIEKKQQETIEHLEAENERLKQGLNKLQARISELEVYAKEWQDEYNDAIAFLVKKCERVIELEARLGDE